MSTSGERLEHLRTRLFEAEAGLLYKGSATRLVFGDGDPDADLMIVGEAPGADEDRLGLPFVGPSGHLLDATLQRAGLERHRVYITNVIKRRPPNNRDPESHEIAISVPWLHAQIAVIRPKVILAVGRFAAGTLATRLGTPISILRTSTLTYQNEKTKVIAPMIATFHPAYILRQVDDARTACLELFAGDVRHAVELVRGEDLGL